MAASHHLVKLKDYGRRRRMHQGTIHADANDPSLAFRNRDKVNGARAPDFRERNAVHRGDLLRVRKQWPCLLGPDHHWRDQIARARRIVIEHTQDVVRTEAKPKLLLDLA